MVRRDGAAIRKERMQEIARHIHRLLEKHNQISLTKTIAGLQYGYGLTKEKIIEYLQILADLGHFLLDKEHDKIQKITEVQD